MVKEAYARGFINALVKLAGVDVATGERVWKALSAAREAATRARSSLTRVGQRLPEMRQQVYGPPTQYEALMASLRKMREGMIR